ncbi:MAG TPA: DUF1800 domain-containing protein [Gemmataceae bacterium]|nr:DUF1800 domain-containing protein [Gemmataceae bacterium]
MADISEKTVDPRWAWQRYRPSKEAPWNLQRVGHLYRRAAFGATHSQLESGLKAGPDALIAQLFKGGPGLAEFDAEMEPLARNIERYNDAAHMRAWWLTRMLHSPHPLQEKITLFWHNHFATSYAKVQSARFMLGQYELMRRHALGNFAELLHEMSSDPAMLIWLDTRNSKKGSPNENYARELMELFSLGIGHYTEKDIREAARAFTGWEIQGAKVVFNKNQHDDGKKTVLGQTGNWKGADIVRICLEQKAAPPFLVGKLYRFLLSETVPATAELLTPLAEQFKQSGYDFGALLKTMLSSNLFFSPIVYRTRVKSPVDFVLGIVRGLEGKIGTTALSQSLEQLGQNIFSPPSVKGWDGSRTWLNGQTLLFRQNLALALTSTQDVRFGRRTDPAILARKYDKKSDTDLVDFFLRLFLQGDVAAETRTHLLDYQQHAHQLPMPVYWTATDAADHRIRALCHLVLSLPEFQLD